MDIRLSGVAAAGALAISTLVGASAQAGYVVTLEEVGSNVVATGSGPLDLTGLSFFETFQAQASVEPFVGGIITGRKPFSKLTHTRDCLAHRASGTATTPRSPTAAAGTWQA